MKKNMFFAVVCLFAIFMVACGSDETVESKTDNNNVVTDNNEEVSDDNTNTAPNGSEGGACINTGSGWACEKGLKCYETSDGFVCLKSANDGNDGSDTNEAVDEMETDNDIVDNNTVTDEEVTDEMVTDNIETDDTMIDDVVTDEIVSDENVVDEDVIVIDNETTPDSDSDNVLTVGNEPGAPCDFTGMCNILKDLVCVNHKCEKIETGDTDTTVTDNDETMNDDDILIVEDDDLVDDVDSNIPDEDSISSKPVLSINKVIMENGVDEGYNGYAFAISIGGNIENTNEYITVSYTVNPDNEDVAIRGYDYRIWNGSSTTNQVVLNPGDVLFLSVETFFDSIIEGTETFSVNISIVDGADKVEMGNSQVTFSIFDVRDLTKGNLGQACFLDLSCYGDWVCREGDTTCQVRPIPSEGYKITRWDWRYLDGQTTCEKQGYPSPAMWTSDQFSPCYGATDVTPLIAVARSYNATTGKWESFSFYELSPKKPVF